ncbi:MAG: 50S ribosomal protein L13 [Chlamydiae bacterium]|nr:50S ribosomal protein L13 [Chlamydiota bacterium]
MKPHTKAQFQKTFLKKKEDAQPSWYILDANGKTLGRFCSEIAKILRGKHKPDFTPHVDCGDGVIVINADKIRVTGNKEAQKVYRHYTGYVGGLREVDFRTQMERNPDLIIKHAVNGMLPKTRLGRKMATRLRVFVGEDHGMEAQKPLKVNI